MLEDFKALEDREFGTFEAEVRPSALLQVVPGPKQLITCHMLGSVVIIWDS